MREETKRWLELAERDCKSARNNFKIKESRVRAFLCHQSVEKLPVDFLCYTPEEFEEMKNKITIVRETVKDGIEIK